MDPDLDPDSAITGRLILEPLQAIDTEAENIGNAIQLGGGLKWFASRKSEKTLFGKANIFIQIVSKYCIWFH